MPVRKEAKTATKSSKAAESVSKVSKAEEDSHIRDSSKKSPAKASSNFQKKVKPTAGAINVDQKKKRPIFKFKPEESFQRFIYQLSKQVHPSLGISSQCMTTLNSIVLDVYRQLAEEAVRLSRSTSSVTLSPLDIQSAAKIVFPGEIRDHAVSDCAKAVVLFDRVRKGQSQN